MINKFKHIGIILGLALIFGLPLGISDDTYAGAAITVSPMNQTKVLIPDKEEHGNFTVANPYGQEEDLNYELIIRPFFYNNKEEISYDAHDDYSLMVNWIKLEKTSGTLKPGEQEIINFTIKAPKDSPAGGQYAAIIVHKIPEQTDAVIVNNFEIAHLIYAEVAGETRHGGKILEANIPSFILSGKVTGTALVQNDGNVHSDAKQTLEVLPLFGNEEYYTNVDDPKETFLMPEAKQYTSVSWDETPSVGIFRVIYNIELEGVNTKVEKTVIICPLWLLIVIAAIIAIAIYRIVSGIISRKEKKE